MMLEEIAFEKDTELLYGESFRKELKMNFKNATIPTSKDVFFRAKQKEIIERYDAARFFLIATARNDWIQEETNRNETIQKYSKLKHRAYFYEAALFYYNTVVDLSWVLCYISAEFAIYKGEQSVSFDEVMTIEEAYELIRKAETLVKNPVSPENPFDYLKKMFSEISKGIDMVIEFWTEFKETSIRKHYNFFKHKGSFLYSEIKQLCPNRIFNFYRVNETKGKNKIVSNLNDVRCESSLEDSISDLQKFDDKKLFPYIYNLFSELEKVIKPSPFVLLF